MFSSHVNKVNPICPNKSIGNLQARDIIFHQSNMTPLTILLDHVDLVPIHVPIRLGKKDSNQIQFELIHQWDLYTPPNRDHQEELVLFQYQNQSYFRAD